MNCWECLTELFKAILNPMTLFLIIITILLIAGLVNWDQIIEITKGIHL